MKQKFRIFPGIKWKLTFTYMLATLLMLFMVEVLIAVSANRYAFTSLNFVYSSAQYLGQSNPLLSNALSDPIDKTILDDWVDSRKDSYLQIPNRNVDRGSQPPDGDGGGGQEPPPQLTDRSLIDLTPKTMAFSASQSTLTVLDSTGMIISTNNKNVFPVGEYIDVFLTEDELDILDMANAALVPAPQFIILEQESVSMALPIRKGSEIVGTIFAQYYAPTLLEQVTAAVVGFFPELPIFILISACIGVIFGFGIASSFTRRLDHLESITMQWGKGDFSTSAEVRGNDEISRLALQLNHMSEQFQALIEKEQLLASMEERNRLARDLHDSVKQQLFAISMNLGALRTLLGSDKKKALQQIEVSSALAQQALDELSMLINTLRPLQLGEQTLSEAVAEFVQVWQKQTGISVVFRKEGEVFSIAPEDEQSLFRVTQEAFSNIRRHSRASAVSMVMHYTPTQMDLQISDNGVGYDMDNVEHGLGLRSMEERINELEGTFAMNSSKNGTSITIQVPRVKGEMGDE